MKAEVSIGVVTNGSKVLIVKRKEGEGNLRWQFPGGSIERGETEAQAVIREIEEETGCRVVVVKLLAERIHPYTHKAISYWACKYIDGEIVVSDDDLEEAKWVEKNELLNYFTTSVFEPVLEYLELA